jgi:hypothetical protein
MKAEVKKILKERGKIDLFTDRNYELVKYAMNERARHDPWLKNYLSLDPYNKAEWVADHLIKWVNKF